MKEIKLTRGLVALVDDSDFEWASRWKWFAQKSGRKFYAARSQVRAGVKKLILMHREIIGNLGALDGEHEDGNSLNNQRSNLRPATRSQNLANKELPKNKTCKSRGVYLGWNGVFIANISVGHRSKYLGTFQDETDAALAYDSAALTHFGSFARLNFPKGNSLPGETKNKNHRQKV